MKIKNVLIRLRGFSSFWVEKTEKSEKAEKILIDFEWPNYRFWTIEDRTDFRIKSWILKSEWTYLI